MHDCKQAGADMCFAQENQDFISDNVTFKVLPLEFTIKVSQNAGQLGLTVHLERLQI